MTNSPAQQLDKARQKSGFFRFTDHPIKLPLITFLIPKPYIFAIFVLYQKSKTMKYLKIQNDGVLDIRLVALMGGTTKANDQYKIGQFGSGLKYTLAYLFRNHIDFKIFSGTQEVKLAIETEVIKDENFDIVCIDGNRTSITTKMGSDWKAWMIIRELYSNALDEGGAKYCIIDETADGFERTSDTTTFFIELTPAILEVFNDWDKYFIVGKLPMYETADFAIHPTSGNLKIYKQGILVHEEESKSLFNYDIKNAAINELREYTGTLSWDLSRIIFKINDPKVISYFLENLSRTTEKDGKLYEAQIDLTFWQDRSKMDTAWHEVLGNAQVIHSEAKEKIIAKQVNVDLSGVIEVPKNLYKALTQSFDGVGALRIANKVNEFYEIYDAALDMLIRQSLTLLESAEYFIHPELTFVFGEFGCKNTLAQVSLDKKEILISQRMKDKSVFEFCAMLIEENEHFQTGLCDETRAFQQHFINLYTKSLFSGAKITL